MENNTGGTGQRGTYKDIDSNQVFEAFRHGLKKVEENPELTPKLMRELIIKQDTLIDAIINAISPQYREEFIKLIEQVIRTWRAIKTSA